MNDELLIKVEHLRSLLCAHATSDVYEYKAEDYIKIRRELIGDPRLRSYIPRFIRDCRDLGEFWTFIKAKFAHYAERRQFIRDELHPLLLVVDEIGTPSDAVYTIILKKVDSAHVQAAWQRATERRSTDPEGSHHSRSDAARERL
jgi:hypothetical protein